MTCSAFVTHSKFLDLTCDMYLTTSVTPPTPSTSSSFRICRRTRRRRILPEPLRPGTASPKCSSDAFCRKVNRIRRSAFALERRCVFKQSRRVKLHRGRYNRSGALNYSNLRRGSVFISGEENWKELKRKRKDTWDFNEYGVIVKGRRKIQRK